VRICSSQQALRVPRKRIAALIAFAARRGGVRIAEADVAVVSGREIAALNRRHLGRTGRTDVLSFDLTHCPGAGLCAQIVVCGDLAVRQARRLRTGPQRELLLYVLHGLLHLIGYDDATPAQAARMHAREDRLLEEFLSSAPAQGGKAP
jgi:probable rRNA maturation factor